MGDAQGGGLSKTRWKYSLQSQVISSNWTKSLFTYISVLSVLVIFIYWHANSKDEPNNKKKGNKNRWRWDNAEVWRWIRRQGGTGKIEACRLPLWEPQLQQVIILKRWQTALLFGKSGGQDGITVIITIKGGGKLERGKQL